ncbi:MAG: hypothetical protein JXL97_15905 [Bacteroidales bacterium]|nr:hypothetical protein [Bacteroidales bacterium]
MENKINQTNVTGNQNIVVQDVSSSNITINVNGNEQKLETAMNQWLVKGVVENITEYNKLAKNFMNSVQNVDDWQMQTKFRKVALIIIQSSYVGVVGNYLKRLSAISNDGFSSNKLKDYISNTYFLSLRLLDFVNIAMLSSIWDYSAKKQIIFYDND